ncbi:MAG: type II 3-dehydroquinate dehydratase [Alphaproteobacteria bacterium]|nr:type II 3-dehydroquinate dehydratase [Alphaproteobacteria bacterium]
MKKILVLNGPNLNMLGLREPEIYGPETLRDVEDLCYETAMGHNMRVECRQTNHEGVLVDWIQEARGIYDGLIINAAAFTHTSVAIHDALRLLDIPIIEVHLSDPKKREEFRHFSYVEPVAARVIAGQGAKGYKLAVEAINELLS